MRKYVLREALRVASRHNPRHPEWGNYHHYSFVVQRNTILAWATNRTGPPFRRLGFDEDQKQHAEPLAWLRARKKLSPGLFEVVNIRLNKRGDLRLSRPCACCTSFLAAAGCTAIWYSTPTGFRNLDV